MKHPNLTFVPATSKEKVNFSAGGPLLLTPKEAAYLLSISPQAVYQLLSRGALPVVRIGRSVRVPRAAIEALAGGEQ